MSKLKLHKEHKLELALLIEKIVKSHGYKVEDIHDFNFSIGINEPYGESFVAVESSGSKAKGLFNISTMGSGSVCPSCHGSGRI